MRSDHRAELGHPLDPRPRPQPAHGRRDSLGPVGYKGNAALEKTEKVRVLLPARTHIRDVRSGKDLGTTREVTAELDPWSPLILETGAGR